MEIGLGGPPDVLCSYRSHRHRGCSTSMFWHSRDTSSYPKTVNQGSSLAWQSGKRPWEDPHIFGDMWVSKVRRTHDFVHPPAIAHTVLWIWRHRRCLLLFQVSRCSSWSSSDRMRVVLHTVMSELIWANPGGGRFEPSASRQPLMKSIKLSTFREHCFTKPLKHTMQQTAELGLSACVESEKAMLLFRGLKTTLQSRALIFSFYF